MKICNNSRIDHFKKRSDCLITQIIIWIDFDWQK